MASPTRTDKSQFHPSFASFIPESLQPKRSSRIGELLLSNNPPLEFEKQDLVETAARGPQILDEFDEKIAATRQLLEFLVSERDQTALNISDAKSVLHPVRRLPDDVLRSFFRACTKSADQVFNEELTNMFPIVNIESVQPTQPPWTVSCVCQQWRTVAIHTGELWSLIELDLDQRYRNKRAGQESRLQTWLITGPIKWARSFHPSSWREERSRRLYDPSNSPPHRSVLEATISLPSFLLISTLFCV